MSHKVKPILWYTLAKEFGLGSFKVLGVTSEGPRGRINGRWVADNHPTHMNVRTTKGRFATATDAEMCRQDVTSIVQKWSKQNTVLYKQASMNDDLCNKEIADVIGKRSDHANMSDDKDGYMS